MTRGRGAGSREMETESGIGRLPVEISSLGARVDVTGQAGGPHTPGVSHWRGGSIEDVPHLMDAQNPDPREKTPRTETVQVSDFIPLIYRLNTGTTPVHSPRTLSSQ